MAKYEQVKIEIILFELSDALNNESLGDNYVDELGGSNSGGGVFI